MRVILRADQRPKKYLRLQADQILKQYPEDLPLLAHLQGLSLFLKEHGHGELPREEDGAVEFWRLKDDLRNDLVQSQYWSDDVWKSKMAGGRGNKNRYQYCTES